MELLIRVVDKPLTGKQAIDCQRTRAGDVIVFQPDGWGWGIEEMANPDWRILRVADLKSVDAEALAASELPLALDDKLIQKRQFTIDLASLDLAEGGRVLAKRTAKNGIADTTVSLANLVAARSLKPRLVDANVIGPASASIG